MLNKLSIFLHQDLETKLSSCRNLVKEQVRFNRIENDISVYANK